MRVIPVVSAFCVVCALTVAQASGAGGGSGMGVGEIPCEHDADAIGRQIDSQASRLPPAHLRQLREQLDVARAQCKEGLDAAEPSLSNLRRELAAEPGGGG